MPQMNTPPQQPQQRIWALRSLQVLLHLAPARLQFQRQPWAWKPGFCPHHLSWWRVWPVPSNYQLQRSPTYHLELQNGAVHWLIDRQEDKPSGKHKKFRLEDMGSPCPITTHNPTLFSNITSEHNRAMACFLSLLRYMRVGPSTAMAQPSWVEHRIDGTHLSTNGSENTALPHMRRSWTEPFPISIHVATTKIRAISNRGSSVKILAGNCWHLLRLKRWASAITSKYLLPWA